ncbi:TenA family protein [Geodermatophilus sabuli]|uniref:Thiaminase /4-amino-5-aminomethyl-2-methylpyrimidine deaminase n=1 Tax=Geodermatophilus sabuli TaxID=1564158 RepID=A0A285EHU3_9ACTN|nr:TenA family protein [Geodermatophilus sabuli]MBB3086202.1 thiaminase/transcriptional activator TenA [Geodermatophilus sabuli]SNX97581.1 thiaminase /4-amino-5-aminomethyl-2-methylpyrimidine deaminase [Geodermatophilus sabuli]
MSSFGERAWAATAGLRAAIDDLPFLAELGSGTLAPAAFRYYLEQDSLYLADYARALALLGARAPDSAAASFWATSAATTATVERQLHADLLGAELPPADRPAGEPVHSPTCLAYVSYLVATAATAPYAVGAAAVLPCYWVYAEVGARLARTAALVPGHPYRRWVAAYDTPEFQAAARGARALVDAAARATPGTEAAMQRAFVVATRYELEFWRSAHERETWPDPLL